MNSIHTDENTVTAHISIVERKIKASNQLLNKLNENIDILSTSLAPYSLSAARPVSPVEAYEESSTFVTELNTIISRLNDFVDITHVMNEDLEL